MREKFYESKMLFENINKDLEKLTKLLKELCEKEHATFNMNIDYNEIYGYYKLNVSIDKTERIEW